MELIDQKNKFYKSLFCKHKVHIPLICRRLMKYSKKKRRNSNLLYRPEKDYSNLLKIFPNYSLCFCSNCWIFKECFFLKLLVFQFLQNRGQKIDKKISKNDFLLLMIRTKFYFSPIPKVTSDTIRRWVDFLTKESSS